MKNKEEILIAGSGGQGVLSAGKILAQSAVEQDKCVTYYPSYGAEIRGGTANCAVIISDREIASPIISLPTVLLIFNMPSYRKFGNNIAKNGLIILNSSLCNIDEVKPVKTDCSIIRIPATTIAQGIGDVRCANLVMLGSVIKITGILEKESIEKSIEIFFKAKKDLIKLNLEALHKGIDYKII